MPYLRNKDEINKTVKSLDEEDLKMYNFAKQNLKFFYQMIDNANEQLETKDKIKTTLSSKDFENDDVLENFILDSLVGEKGNEESIQTANKRKRIQQKANLVHKRYDAKCDIRDEYQKKYGINSLINRLPAYTTKIAKEDGSDKLECEKHNLYENFMYGDRDYKQIILEDHFKKMIDFDYTKMVNIIASNDPEKLIDYSLEEPEIIDSMFTISAIYGKFDYNIAKKEFKDYKNYIMPAIDGVGSLFQGDVYTNYMYRFFDTSSLNVTNCTTLSLARSELVRKKSLDLVPDKNPSKLQEDSATFWRKDDWINFGMANDEKKKNIELAEYVKNPLKYKAVQIVNDKEVEVPLLKVHEGSIKGKIVERTQEEIDILKGDFAIDAEKEHYTEVRQDVKELKEKISNAKSLEDLQTITDAEVKHLKEKEKAIDEKRFNDQFDKLTDRQKQLFNDAKIMYTILADGAERYNNDKRNTKKLNPVVFDRWKVLSQVRSAKIDKIQQKAIEVDKLKEKSTDLAKEYYNKLGYDEHRAGEDLGRTADGILLSENNSHGYDDIKRQNMADIALLSSSRSYIKPLQKIIQNKLMKANIGDIIKYGVETDPIEKLNFYLQHEDDLKSLFGSYKSINIDENAKVKYSNKETRNYLANMRTFFEGIGGLFNPDEYKHDMLEFLPNEYSTEELLNMLSNTAVTEIGNLTKEERKIHRDNLGDILITKSLREDYQSKVQSRKQKLFGIKSLLDYKAVNAQGKEVPFDDYVTNVDGVKLAKRSEQEKAQIQKMFAPEFEYEMECRAREIEFTRKLFEKAPEKDLENLMKTFSRNRDAIFKSAGFTETENTGKKINETVAKNQKVESLAVKKSEYAKHNFLWKIFMPVAYRSRSEIKKAENELNPTMTLADKLYLKSAEKNSFDKKGLNDVINDFKKNYANPENVDKTKLLNDYASIIKYTRKFPQDFSKSGITLDDITATSKTLVGKENETAITEITNEREFRNIDKKLTETYSAIKERNNASIMQQLDEKNPNELANWVNLLSTEVNGQDVSTEQFYDDLEERTKSVNSVDTAKDKDRNTEEIKPLDKGQNKVR